MIEDMKHIDDEENAQDLAAARKAHGIDQLLAAGSVPPAIQRYIEYLEHEWSAEHYLVGVHMKRYFDLQNAIEKSGDEEKYQRMVTAFNMIDSAITELNGVLPDYEGMIVGGELWELMIQFEKLKAKYLKVSEQ